MVSSKLSVSTDDVKPKARIAKRLEPTRRAKPLPKLANPEQFRATNTPRKFHREFREVPIGPSGREAPMFGRKIPTGLGGQDKDEPSWLDNLPRPTLTPGLRGMPFQRASANRQTDPLLNFAQTAEVAMDFRMNGSSHVKTWRSPNLSHRPIYFEDENLERYGNGHATLQPFISGGKFFSTASSCRTTLVLSHQAIVFMRWVTSVPAIAIRRTSKTVNSVVVDCLTS